MPSPTQSRASSRSPTRKPNTPSRLSPQTTPKRTPLLERSDSQKNASYRPSPFPTLPSQIFAPKSNPYGFGDELPNSRASPVIPAKSSKRSSHSSNSWSTSSARSDASAEKPHLQDASPLFGTPPSPQASPGEKQDDDRLNRVRRRTVTSPRKSVDISPAATAASTGVDTGESSMMGAQRVFAPTKRQESVRSPESFAAPKKHQHGSSDGSSGPIPRHKTVQRLRSQSSIASRSKKQTQTGQVESPRLSDERPRSASSPNTPTDAFIQALINSGANVQYPKLKKPSATSLRSESVLTGAAYPPPLKLQRKRANSQLAKAVSIAPESLEPRSDAASSSIQSQRLMLAVSQASFMTRASDRSTTWNGSYSEYNYARWSNEIEDTVTELHTHSVNRQDSDVQSNSVYRSQQASHESLRSSAGSFYHFLNDSRTAWARVYYRGDGRLRLETPPNVEYVVEMETPDQRPRTASQSEQDCSPGSAGFPDRIYVPRVRPLNGGASNYQNAKTSRLQMMSTQDSSSPYSTTETDSSIMPRMRSFQPSSSSPYGTSGTDSSTVPGMGTFLDSSSTPYHTTDTRSSSIPRRTFQPRDFSSPQIPMEEDSSSLPQMRLVLGGRNFSFAPSETGSMTALPEIRRDDSMPLASPIFNPTPELPHLSPSRRTGPWIPYWRAPSIEGHWSWSPYDKSNSQIGLFCFGFLFPPAWWIAAFLPLPKRPQWQRGSGSARVHVEGSVDLFDSIDIYQYQKAQWWRNLNRFMALAGVLIVAAIIACAVVATT